MKKAVAGANAVNAASSSVSGAIHTDTRPAVSVISSVGAMKNVAVSASALPGVSIRNRDRPLLRKLTKRSDYDQEAAEESEIFLPDSSQ